MSTRTALALTEIGKPLTKITLPGPDTFELEENELLIKLTAAGLAPHDYKLRDKNLLNIGDNLPAVLGLDLVGTVVKADAGVSSSFPIGAQIFSQPSFKRPANGALQEYTVVDGTYAAIVPPGISATEAALYPINAVTSAMALFTSAGFGIPFPRTPESAGFDYASQKLVVIGGGSNTGQLAVQFAKIAGIGTIIAIASLSKTAVLKDFGATHIIARQDSDIESQVRKIVGDDLVYVYDAVTGGDFSLAVSLLSNTKRGTLARLLHGKADEAVVAQKKAGFDDKRVFGSAGEIPEFGKLFWKVFPTWLESGKVKPLPYKVIEGLDADKINAVLDSYKDETRGAERYHVKFPA